MSEQIVEIELDPLGYAPRPDLFVRNLSPNTITFNMGNLRWSLPPWPSDDYEQPLPWTVAKSSGFERLWEREQVLVSIDNDFEEIIHELPEGGVLFRPYVHLQETPQAVTDITHNLMRSGPVIMSVFSLDGQTEYWNFFTEMRDNNTVRISFDDPVAFMATVF